MVKGEVVAFGDGIGVWGLEFGECGFLAGSCDLAGDPSAVLELDEVAVGSG